MSNLPKLCWSLQFICILLSAISMLTATVNATNNQTMNNETSDANATIINPNCKSIPYNREHADDVQCSKCGPPLNWEWWPCDKKVCYGDCGSFIGNTTNYTGYASCHMIPENTAGANNFSCALCSPMVNYTWWPCNKKPAVCGGDCLFHNTTLDMDNETSTPMSNDTMNNETSTPMNNETSEAMKNDTAKLNPNCKVIPNNKPGITDPACGVCGPPQDSQFWPCSVKEPYLCYGECGALINNSVLVKPRKADPNALCSAKPDALKLGKTTDAGCLQCGPPFNRLWWPCNARPAICKGDCGAVVALNAPTTEDVENKSQNGSGLASIMIPVVVVAALVVVAAVFYYKRRNSNDDSYREMNSLGGKGYPTI